MNTTLLDATRRIPATGERALVLGGGGSAGNAWLIGVIAGLADAGADLTRADLMIGTSAGSTAAAAITAAKPADLFAAVLDTPVPQRPDQARSGGPGLPGSAAGHLERTAAIIAASQDPADMRRRQGAAAIELADEAWRDRWRATVAPRLPSRTWPEQLVLMTAVDAETGDPVAFDRDSGVELVDAVAASCAGGPAYRIGDRRYIDGGYRSVENADWAAGFERVLVLSPLGGRTRMPLEWGTNLAAQVDGLRAGGSRVETVRPDPAALAAFGDNLMDPSTRPPAARAGYEQGRALTTVAALWG